MMFAFSRMSLLWKILLSTSVALTILFVATLSIVQRRVVRTTYRTLQEEVNGSFQAYDSLWKAQADKLAAIGLVLSKMSDVRAAFRTEDQATIRDTAGELWSAISDRKALFLVADPEGKPIASLGGVADYSLTENIPVVRASKVHFPRQTSGFMLQGGHLYQIVVTPVYIDSAQGETLLNVLVAGYLVDSLLATQFKDASGGSEFVFLSDNRVIASTLTEGVPGHPEDYVSISKPLLGVGGDPVGELRIYRSFAAARQSVSALRRDIYLIWFAAVVIGLAFTGWLARKIVEPVKELDRAAGQIAKENYNVRVSEGSGDEVGRLGRTFNAMCAALQSARANLIRQERFSTISRLSTSLVHDLRNPLAAIYGGTEMLVDLDLPPATVKRLAANIYGASRRVRELLTDLASTTRGKFQAAELCKVREVITAACDASVAAAGNQSVQIHVDVPEHLELPLERGRMERVFCNLVTNALEATPAGGEIRIAGKESGDSVLVEVEDTGSGVPPEIRSRLFEPFTTAGKKDGLGLGLAVSRQTVLDHGGDLWMEPADGARFVIRLPLKKAPGAEPSAGSEDSA